MTQSSQRARGHREKSWRLRAALPSFADPVRELLPADAGHEAHEESSERGQDNQNADDGKANPCFSIDPLQSEGEYGEE